MMTRETKAGLVVSCSFLCLVGIVLVSKLRESHNPDTSGDPGDAALAQSTAEPKPAGDPQPELAAAQKAQLIVAQNENKQKSDKGALAQKTAKPPDNKVIPAAFNGEGAATSLNSVMTPQNQTPQKTSPALTPPSLRKEKEKESAAVALEDAAPVMDSGSANPPTTNQTPAPATAVAQPTAREKKASILIWVPDAEKKKATSLQGMGLRRPGEAAILANQTQPATGVTGGDLTTPADGAKRSVVLPPFEQLATPNLDSKPPADKTGAPTIISIRPAASTLNSQGSAGAGSVTSVPTPKFGNDEIGASSLAPKLDRNSTGAGISSATPTLGQDGPSDRGVRLDAPVLASSSQTATGQAVSPRTPLGAPIPAASAPIVSAPMSTRSGTVSAPQVESYDEDTFTCKGTESFRSISQAAYQADGYDQALLLFNRNHPLANDAVKQNPPLLQPGQPIYIPPLRILRKYYAASIVETAGTTPARGATSAETASGVSLAAPASLATTPTATRAYRVGANAEMIRDIARRTLGNADRWTEIYQLNRTLDPTYAVPASTELKLPADARVDAQ